MSLPHLICIDDDSLTLHMLQSQLTRVFSDRFQLHFIDSGIKAVAFCRKCKRENEEVAIVICDQYMPSLSGVDTLIHISKIFPYCKSIMLTGQANLQTVANALNEAQLFYFLEKPWNWKTMMELVEKAEAIWKKSIHTEQMSILHAQQLLKDLAQTKLISNKHLHVEMRESAILYVTIQNLNSLFASFGAKTLLQRIFEMFEEFKIELEKQHGDIVFCDGHTLLALLPSQTPLLPLIKLLFRKSKMINRIQMGIGANCGNVIWGKNLNLSDNFVYVGSTIDQCKQLAQWAMDDRGFALISQDISDSTGLSVSSRKLQTFSGTQNVYLWPSI